MPRKLQTIGDFGGGPLVSIDSSTSKSPVLSLSVIVFLIISLIALDAYVILEIYDAVRTKNSVLDLQLNLEPSVGTGAVLLKTKLEKRQLRVTGTSADISAGAQTGKVKFSFNSCGLELVVLY